MSENRGEDYEQATTWALDLDAAHRRQLGQARLFALAMMLVAVLEAVALMLLTPLKRVTPIPVLVDRQSGYVEVLRSDGTQQLRGDIALTRSLLAQYVMAREDFDVMTVASDYRKVALWSDGAARRDYLALMPATNPSSPFRLYPRTSVVETSIESISSLGPHTALVRFETRRRDQDGAVAAPQAWVAVATWRFTDAPMLVANRLLNPLGFQVTRYRKDPEAPPAELAVPTIGVAAVPPPAAPTATPSATKP